MFDDVSDRDIFLENLVSTKAPSLPASPSRLSKHMARFRQDTFSLDQLMDDNCVLPIDVSPLVLRIHPVDVELISLSTPTPKPIYAK